MSGTTISARVLADSTAAHGIRLTTLEVTLPMFVQPQLLRHRAFSFSVQSTRAVPLAEQIRRVETDPCMPLRWGAAQRGMVAAEVLTGEKEALARMAWDTARLAAVASARHLLDLGAHQEVAARVLAPFQWCKAIITATDWDNFFALRIDAHAQGEIRVLAEAMRDALAGSEPSFRSNGEWHLPLVDDEDRATLPEHELRLVSAGRCARVSFLQHDGKRDAGRDLALGRRLHADAHWSALEHQAMARETKGPSGNLRGWYQARKLWANEDNRAAWLAAKEER